MVKLQEYYDVDDDIFAGIEKFVPAMRHDLINHWLADGLRWYKRDVLGVDIKLTDTEMLRMLRDGYTLSKDKNV
ncbi:MAG: hypothetical protein Q4B88_02865 [Moraxella sp.]|nr:hypothetical protein [Moraxella sp.]